MATESNPLILHTNQGVPSKKAFLVAIPMYMYRIKTQDFRGGLDFFQHSVLRFKLRPDISDKDIANYLGLDERLVANINDSLKDLELLTDCGTITDNGKIALQDPHKLLTKDSKKVNRLGYVFKLPANDAMLNTYVEEISPANVKGLFGEEKELVEEDSYGKVNFLPILELAPKYDTRAHVPTEMEILHILEAKYCREKESEEETPIDVKRQELSIQFVPDRKPTKVLVCTYVYLPVINEEVYASDWVVMDPFKNENSPQLKFYLESINDPLFQSAISDKFSEAQTVEMLSFGQLRKKLEQMVEDEIAAMWGSAFERLDANLQTYVKIVMQKKREMGYCHYTSRDLSQSFVSNIQAALECILKADRISRNSTYKYNRGAFDERQTRRSLSSILRGSVSVETDTFNILFFTLRKLVSNDQEPCSLRQYLPEFLLSYENKVNDSKFIAIGSRIKILWEIAGIRNDHDHGQTESEGALIALTQEESDKYYQLLIDIITEQTK